MAAIYHLRVKKDYATAVIEDLRKLDAIELIAEGEATVKPKFKASDLRSKVPTMTNEEIDKQLNELRNGW